MSDFIHIHLHNHTGKTMYASVKSNSAREIAWWAHLQNEAPLQWSRFHYQHSNLLIKGELTKICYPNDINGSATIYFSTKPIEHVPDFESSLFIYDQVEITNRIHIKKEHGPDEQYLAKAKLSHVNFFGMPIRMETKNEKVGFDDKTSRQKLLAALAEIDTPFDTYRISRTHPNTYRHFSPAWRDPCNIWQEAIRGGLAAISNSTVHFDGPAGNEKTKIEFGKSTDDSIEVTETALDTDDNPIIIRKFTVQNIDTFKAIRGTLFPEEVKVLFSKTAAPGEADEQLNQTIKSGALLSAALHRGVLHDPTLWAPKPIDRAENYYQASDENYGQYNEYSKVLHEHALDGKCFGFCYDNFYAQGKMLKIAGSTDYDKDADANLTITLLPFGA